MRGRRHAWATQRSADVREKMRRCDARCSPLALLVAALAASGCGGGSGGRLGILFLSDRDGSWALYAMPPKGGTARRVFRAGSVEPFGGSVGAGEPLVSPDGREVLLARNGVAAVSLATGRQLWHGAGEEAVADWSPDGRRIVWRSALARFGRWHVRCRPAKRPAPHPLQYDDSAPTRVGIWSPAWSPDGRWIAFSRQVGSGPDELYVIHPDGSDLRRLTRYEPLSTRLVWSKQGPGVHRRARHEWAAHAARDYVDAARPRPPLQRLHASFGLRSITVAWSPDGTRSPTQRPIKDEGPPALYLVGADGRHLRRFHGGGRASTTSRWCGHPTARKRPARRPGLLDDEQPAVARACSRPGLARRRQPAGGQV